MDGVNNGSVVTFAVGNERESATTSNYKELASTLDAEHQQFYHSKNAQSPTLILAKQLTLLGEFANQAFFDGDLPPFMITLDQSGRPKRSFFKAESFSSKSGEFINEIGVSSPYILIASLSDVFQSISYGLSHLANYVSEPTLNKRPTSAYCCHKVAKLMEERCGLMTSNTGMPNGKRTGGRMSYYAIPGGIFEQACNELVKQAFAISWGSAAEDLRIQRLKDVTGKGFTPKSKSRDPSKNKIKFSCKSCYKPCWAEPKRFLKCGDCDVAMTASK